VAGALAGGDLQLLNPKHTLGFVLFSSKTNKIPNTIVNENVKARPRNFNIT